MVLLFHGKWMEAVAMFPPLPAQLVTLLWVLIAKLSKKVFSRPFVVMTIVDFALLVFNCVYQNIIN